MPLIRPDPEIRIPPGSSCRVKHSCQRAYRDLNSRVDRSDCENPIGLLATLVVARFTITDIEIGAGLT